MRALLKSPNDNCLKPDDAGVSSLASEGRRGDHVFELDGLRALLALWVLVSHVLALSCTSLPLPAKISTLITGGAYAVDVFVIMSGFVIFLLLDRRPQRYRAYLGQRFMRLAPMFLVACTFAWIIRPLMVIDLQHWHSVISAHVVQSELEFYQAVSLHPIWHSLAHATLLHGLVPDSVLLHANLAILPPGWSVSLEWQFYILAPVAFNLVRRRQFVTLGWLGLLASASNIVLGRIGPGAALVNHADFFLVGMVSHEIYRFVDARPDAARESIVRLTPWLFVATAALSWQLLESQRVVPLAIWIIFLSLMLLRRVDPLGPLARSFKASFGHPWLRWIGKMSYCVYLLHQPVIYAVQAVAFSVVDIRDPYRLAAFTFATTVPITFLLAWACHHLVERPGIRLGKRLFESNAN